MTFDPTQHSANSSLRENILEHTLIAEFLKHLWRAGVTDCEILRSEFDGFGYDLVMSRGAVTRHVQLKSGTRPPAKVSVAVAMQDKPSACVVFLETNDALDLCAYHWFGNEPGLPIERLDQLETTLRATRNKQGDRPIREAHRTLRRTHFTQLHSIEELLEKLIGPYSS